MVFGMNTVDIPETAAHQSIFRAAALPLTLQVALCTLYVLNLPPLQRWWRTVTNGDGF